MRTTALIVASLLIVACSGSESSDTTDVSAGSTTTNEDTTGSTGSTDATASTSTTPSSSSSSSSSSTTGSSAPETTTALRPTISTIDGRISSNSVPPGGGPATTAPAPAAPTTIAGTTNTTRPPTATTTAPTSANQPDAAAARRGFEAAIAGYSADDGYVELPECPLDPSGQLLTATFANITDAAIVAAVASPSESGVFDLGGDFGPMVACDRFSDDGPDSVGVFAFTAPADLNAYAEYFANPDEVEGVETRVDPTTTLGAGVFHHVCGFDAADPEFDFCEVDWVTDDVVIGVYVAGPTSSQIDLTALETGMSAQLSAIVDAFGA